MAQVDIKINCAEAFKPFLAPARYKVAEGGRGGGKSHFFGELGVMEVFSFGKKMLCCREVQKSIKESVKALIESKIYKMGLQDYFTITEYEIRCNHNSGKISFTGLRQQGAGKSAADNVKSYEGYDICWVEEAQTISKYSLDILLPTIRKPGSEVWFSYNRKEEGEPVHSKFVESEHVPEGTVHIYVNYWDNPWFPPELRQLMESDKANSLDDYNHIWCGLPQKRSKATIFTRWRVAECEPTAEDKLFYGIDFGFYPDPCCALRLWLDHTLKRIYIDYTKYGTYLDPDMIGPDLLAKIPGSEHGKIMADSARPEIISKLIKNGYNVEGASKPPGSVDFGVSWLQSWEIWIHPRCKDEVCENHSKDLQRKKEEFPNYNIVKEMNNYKYKVDPQTGEVLPKIIDDFNHAIDTIRYALSKIILSEKKLDYKAMAGASNSLKEFEQQRLTGMLQNGLIIPDLPKGTEVEQPGDGMTYLNARKMGLKLPGNPRGIWI